MLNKPSLCMYEKKMAEQPVERLIALGEKRDRQAAQLSSRESHLVVEAILQYLEREEKV